MQNCPVTATPKADQPFLDRIQVGQHQRAVQLMLSAFTGTREQDALVLGKCVTKTETLRGSTRETAVGSSSDPDYFPTTSILPFFSK